MAGTLFLDTFALGKVARDTTLSQAVRKFILGNDYTLVISTLNLIEIYPVQSLWPPVAEFVASVPFCIARNSDKILAVEMLNYPNKIELPTGFCSRDYAMSKLELKNAIETNLKGKISDFDSSWRKEKLGIWQALIENKKTFPPEQNGKYSDFQRWLFLQKNVLMFVVEEDKDFASKTIEEGNHIIIECFKSMYILTLAVFLEYYVQGKLGKASDIGDFFQLGYAPYVDLAVFDNERNALAQRIRRLSTPLGTISSYNFRQFVDIVNGKN